MRAIDLPPAKAPVTVLPSGASRLAALGRKPVDPLELLLLAVLFVVGLRRLFSVTSSMDRMRPRYMGILGRFLCCPAS